jgi:serine/threonine protein kinase
LNPANVFVLQDQRIKLTGFAIGPCDQESSTSAAKLAYASPQVLDGETPLPGDDVFSFACIAYEILTGRHPFQQRPANAARAEGLRPDAPAALTNEQAAALQSALSFERDVRPYDIRALAKTLAPDPQRARRVVYQPEIEPARRDDDKRWWWAAGACLVAMVASVVLTRIMT